MKNCSTNRTDKFAINTNNTKIAGQDVILNKQTINAIQNNTNRANVHKLSIGVDTQKQIRTKECTVLASEQDRT